MPTFSQLIRPEVELLIEQAKQQGVVIDYVLAQFASPLSIIDGHRATAVSTLRQLQRNWQQQVPLLAQSAGVPESTFWKFTLDEDLLARQQSRPVSPAAFFGIYFDLPTGKPLVRGADGRHTHLFYFDAPTGPAVLDLRQAEGEEKGYAQLFFDPPYFLRGSQLENSALFITLNQALFGPDLSGLDIQAWPTDCSSYFEAGQEWWGSYFWTVFSPAHNWFVGLTASTTD